MKSMGVFLLALFPLLSMAADQANWKSLETLRPGDKVGIIQSDMKRIEGKFLESTDVAITIHTDQDLSLKKESVVRVYRRPHLSRRNRTLLGAAIGAGAAGAVAAALANRSNDEGFFGGANNAAGVGVSIAGGAGIGAAIGAGTGGGYKTIYQRK